MKGVDACAHCTCQGDHDVCAEYVWESLCMPAHQHDSPGPESKGLWYVWIDHDCWAEQSGKRSAPEIRQASSFDGDHRLPRAVKRLRLKREKKTVSKTVIEERKMDDKKRQKQMCYGHLYIQSAARWRDQKVICGVICFYNWTTYKLIWKSFLDFGKEEGLALADWMSLEKNSAISCTFESYLAFGLKSGSLVQKHSSRSWEWFDRFKFYSPENPIKLLCMQELTQKCVSGMDA